MVAVALLPFVVALLQGGWQPLAAQKDPLTDIETVGFQLRAEPQEDSLGRSVDGLDAPVLIVVCENERFAVKLGTTLEMRPSPEAIGLRHAMLRFDQDRIEQWSWAADPGTRTYWAQKNQELAVRMLKATRLRIELFSPEGVREVATFLVAGLADVLPRVTAACGMTGRE